MSNAAARPVRDDGLVRTTLRIGAGLSDASRAAVVHALQRVPGVLTVDVTADNRQAFVAHDAAVQTGSLVAAVHHAGSTAKAVAASGSVGMFAGPAAAQPTIQRGQLLSAVGVAGVLATILIDIALATRPERRYLFIIPVVVFGGYALLRSTLARRS